MVIPWLGLINIGPEALDTPGEGRVFSGVSKSMDVGPTIRLK
jgi:hypothetical protein